MAPSSAGAPHSGPLVPDRPPSPLTLGSATGLPAAAKQYSHSSLLHLKLCISVATGRTRGGTLTSSLALRAPKESRLGAWPRPPHLQTPPSALIGAAGGGQHAGVVAAPPGKCGRPETRSQKAAPTRPLAALETPRTPLLLQASILALRTALGKGRPLGPWEPGVDSPRFHSANRRGAGLQVQEGMAQHDPRLCLKPHYTSAPKLQLMWAPQLRAFGSRLHTALQVSELPSLGLRSTCDQMTASAGSTVSVVVRMSFSPRPQIRFPLCPTFPTWTLSSFPPDTPGF
ncbi:uncharacterized protein LOC129635080 [Bubalus kerabau]|uniref:uncharacterized protein LOC129635080 n=1 Tax=Bubalus carabanensis TaxID=3119969 RepID=UPI00244E97DB|nr:uncharacterized protein LOC129635080 [Bubalus carabanensis]